MFFKITFGTFLDYSPRGQSKNSLKSRRICDKIKAGNPVILERLIHHLKSLPKDHQLLLLFSDSVLVPIPRSTPLVEGALWPSNILCETLVENGFGKSVHPIIKRNVKVVKSSSRGRANERPTIATHFKSLGAYPTLETPSKILLVDDVFTLGRTSCACYLKLIKAFPECEISVFAPLRTKGLQREIDQIMNPKVSVMKFNQDTGKVQLPD